MWQEIAIIIIALGVIIHIGGKIYRALTAPKPSNPCAGCAGCTLMDEIQKNKTEKTSKKT